MTSPHPVTADFAALERYAYALFRDAADAPAPDARRRARLASAALDAERLSAAADATRESGWYIPLPHRLWLAHLLWLEDVLRTLDCRPGDVTAVELAGLQAVARARARFLREHVFCPHCDAANPRFASAKTQRCRHCQREY
jgi:hypothetical protein